MKPFKHLKKIIIHKFWVCYYCHKCGLVWRGLVHDMSKFSLIEFWESAKYYQGTSSPINAAKANKGYSLAWQHHKGRNRHHYEHWTDNYDLGTTAIPIPYVFAVEMVCDYLGAARAYWGKAFTFEKELEWWSTKKEHAFMHPRTKKFVTTVFNYLGSGHKLDKHLVKMLYTLTN